MKRWFLIPFLSLTISLQSFAQIAPHHIEEEENILLSYEEFSQLTHVEKKTYVKKLREIMIETAKAYPEMAEAMSAQSEFYGQLWTLMVASAVSEEGNKPSDSAKAGFIDKIAKKNIDEYLKMVDSTKTDQMTDAQRGELVQRYRQAMVWTGMAAQWGHDIKDPAEKKKAFDETINPMKARIEKYEGKVKAAAGAGSYEKANDYMKKAYEGKYAADNNKVVPETLVAAGERLPALSIKADGTAGSKPVAKTEEKPQPKEEKKPEVAPAVANKDKKKDEKKPDADPNKDFEREKQKAADAARKNAKPETPVKQDTPPPKEGVDAYYRCMYAGFVIKNHPCMAPSELPWDLKGLDHEQFKCNKGTVMCNPFLFGFKTSCDWSKAKDDQSSVDCYKEAKPFCVNPGLYATKNCGENSNTDSALEAAVHLIDKNREAFNLYSKSFGDLCQRDLINFNSYKGQYKPKNIARTKADIKRTCENARVRMQEIIKRYGITRNAKAGAAAPATQPATENKGAK